MGYLRSMSLNFQIHGYFPHIVLLLISCLIPLCSENRLHDLNPLKFIESFFYGPEYGIYPGECSMYMPKKCVFCCCWMYCFINVIYILNELTFLLYKMSFFVPGSISCLEIYYDL